MKIKYFLIAVAVIVLAVFGYAFFTATGNLGGVSNYLDTSASGYTTASSSIGTAAATQMFSSVSKLVTIINPTTNDITCKLESTGSTAASSTVTAGFGLIIGSNTTTSTIPSVVQFGECYPGSVSCYPHKGALNCISAVTSTIIKLTR